MVLVLSLPKSSLDCKKIKPVNPEGNQPWLFTGRTNAEAQVPKLWPPDANSLLTGKDPDAGRDWGQEEKGPQRMRQLDSITDSMDMNLSKLWVTVNYWEAWLAAIHGVAKSHTWFGEWTAIVLCVHMRDTQGKMSNSQIWLKYYQ